MDGGCIYKKKTGGGDGDLVRVVTLGRLIARLFRLLLHPCRIHMCG